MSHDLRTAALWLIFTPQDFVTLQFIPPGTDLRPILPVLTKVFDQVSPWGPCFRNACLWLVDRCLAAMQAAGTARGALHPRLFTLPHHTEPRLHVRAT